MANTIAKQKASRKAHSRRQEEESTPRRQCPDLASIMDHFLQALSVVVVCHRSLATEVHETVHEEQVLRAAIELLQRVYDEVDTAYAYFKKQGHVIESCRAPDTSSAQRSN